MSVDVEEQLRQHAASLAADTAPIGLDEILGRRQGSHDPVDTVLEVREPARRGPGRTISLIGAAAAACIITIAGLATLTFRTEGEAPGDVPAAQVPTAPPGALVLEPMPDGWSLVLAAAYDLQPLPDAPTVQSPPPGNPATAYATDPAAAGEFAMVLIQKYYAGVTEPSVADDAITVDVDGVAATLHDGPYGRTLTLQRNGTWYALSTRTFNDTQLEQMAAATSEDVDGRPAIDPGALPAELTNRRTGRIQDPWWIDTSAEGHSVFLSNWTYGDNQNLWYESVADPDGASPLAGSGTSQQQVTVWGQAATAVTHHLDRPFHTITWTSAGRTYMLGGRNDLSIEDLTAIANTLRPATASEWEQALKAHGPQPPAAATEPANEQPTSTVEH